jgi:lipid-A-disaccharide synthase
MCDEPRNIAASRPFRIFLVAGEHSGDALGAKLMAALKAKLGNNGVTFAGVGAEEMAHEGLASIFQMADVAVMGPLHILKALPRIVRRVYQTVDAALDFKPDAAVIIDSPEFTHPIARRIRKRAPGIPIIDFVCPSVWAWRSGRAPKMARYIDEVLCLLPFEPEALRKLKGPHGTYAGHPLIERLDEIRNAPAAALAERLKLDPAKPVLLVLPGSRRSEVAHLIGDFGATVEHLARVHPDLGVVIPAVRHLRDRIASATAGWAVKPNIVDSDDKYAAMRLAKAALAASGTVTLELGLAGTPSVVAYKSDNVTAFVVSRLITTDTAVLTNLVLGERVYPEFIQHDCTAEKMSAALLPLLGDTPQRAAQLAALARIPERMYLDHGTPSQAAAEAVLNVISQTRRA